MERVFFSGLPVNGETDRIVSVPPPPYPWDLPLVSFSLCRTGLIYGLVMCPRPPQVRVVMFPLGGLPCYCFIVFPIPPPLSSIGEVSVACSRYSSVWKSVCPGTVGRTVSFHQCFSCSCPSESFFHLFSFLSSRQDDGLEVS